MGEWKTTTIGEISCLVTKGTTPTTIGGCFTPSGINFVKVESITDDGRLLPEKMAHIDGATNKMLERSILAEDDILFTIAGTIGRTAIVTKSILPANTNQAVAIIRPKGKEILPRYLYYVLNDKNRVRYANSRIVQSVQANFSLKELSCLSIPYPEIDEQRAIAHILGTLDDKIELNRRMNETQEGIARALFKSWFIDFDPVRAKAEERQPFGMNEETAALFPDQFEDSELGETPKGWKNGSLKDIISEIISGSRPRGGAVECGIPSIGAENVLGIGRYNYSSEKYVPYDHFKLLKKKGAIVRSGDVLMYKDGVYIGRTSFFDYDFPHKHCCINEHVFILRSSLPNYQLFLYYWLNLENIKEELTNLNSNSAQPGLTQSAVLTIPILIPPADIIDEFFKTVSPLVQRLFENCHESTSLIQLRDSLLPKLISGNIRVVPSQFGFSNGEKKVGEV